MPSSATVLKEPMPQQTEPSAVEAEFTSSEEPEPCESSTTEESEALLWESVGLYPSWPL